MTDTARYRIRWANVQYANGRSLSTQRMCIAERKTRLFRLWWPIADWRWEEQRAQRDVNDDIKLRTPLPEPVEYTGRIPITLGTPPHGGSAVIPPPNR